jgi:hypothetical protein
VFPPDSWRALFNQPSTLSFLEAAMNSRILPETLRKTLVLRHESNSRESGMAAARVGGIAAALRGNGGGSRSPSDGERLTAASLKAATELNMAAANYSRPVGHVVEDDHTLRHLTGAVLEETGLRMIEAASAEEALHLLRGRTEEVMFAFVNVLSRVS